MSGSRSQNDAENAANAKWEARIRAEERELCASLIEAHAHWAGDKTCAQLAAAIRESGPVKP